MTLIQISEPETALDMPLAKQALIVGIDLGTTYSLIAVVKEGKPCVLKDADGVALLPSVVRYDAQGQYCVGQSAKNALADDPANTIFSIKRLMGRSLSDLQVLPLPYQLIDVSKMVRVRTVSGEKTPVEMSAHILSTLCMRAQKVTQNSELPPSPIRAVITVPAYFDDAQRQATKDAARLAGIELIRLLSEPTAAALAYGVDQSTEGIYAIYDLGGGTFDISLLKFSTGLFEVCAVGGDSALGGDDFDHALVEYVFSTINPTALLSSLSPSDLNALWDAARTAKEALSLNAQVRVHCQLANGQLIDCKITQLDLKKCTEHLVARTLDLMQQALFDAQLTPDKIQEVMLVGGATRMPVIRQAVSAFFKRQPLYSIDPDQAVVMGAALQADLLSGSRTDSANWLLLDVTPLSLGVEMMGGLVEKIIPRNTHIPALREQEFTTFEDGQSAMVIHVVQGERDLARDCRSLARFELKGIPPQAAGAARIRVTYQIDADGLLSVQAREVHSNVCASVQIKPAYGLDNQEIQNILQNSFDKTEIDKATRCFKEKQLEAQHIIRATQNALNSEDRHLLKSEEHSAIQKSLHALIDALNHSDILLASPSEQVLIDHRDLLAQKIEMLSMAAEVFIQKRISEKIRSILH